MRRTNCKPLSQLIALTNWTAAKRKEQHSMKGDGMPIFPNTTASWYTLIPDRTISDRDKEQNTTATNENYGYQPTPYTRRVGPCMRNTTKSLWWHLNGGGFRQAGWRAKGEFNWGSFLPFGGLAVVPDRCFADQMRTDWIISPPSCVGACDRQRAKCEFAWRRKLH